MAEFVDLADNIQLSHDFLCLLVTSIYRVPL